MFHQSLLQHIEADRAAAPVDPALLTDREKNAKIRALQGRVSEMEDIATFLANLLQAVEVHSREPIISATFLRELVGRRWECMTQVLIVEPTQLPPPPTIRTEPETGAESFARRVI